MTFSTFQGSAVTHYAGGMGKFITPGVKFLKDINFVMYQKSYSNIPNDCQDFANLPHGYFNLGHPVYTYVDTLCLASLMKITDNLLVPC